MTIELSNSGVCALQALIILVSCGAAALPLPERGYLHLWCQFRRGHCCCELRAAGRVRLIQKVTSTDVPVILPPAPFLLAIQAYEIILSSRKTKCETNRRRLKIVRHEPTAALNSATRTDYRAPTLKNHWPTAAERPITMPRTNRATPCIARLPLTAGRVCNKPPACRSSANFNFARRHGPTRSPS